MPFAIKKAPLLALLLFVLSQSAPAQGTASLPRVHYFYNSGWLVETPKYALVFDFVAHKESGISIATLKQALHRAAAARKKVLLFITHNHPDHFDSSVFNLAGEVSNLTYVLGWAPPQKPSLPSWHAVLPGDSLVRNDYAVYTHAANDDGVGFLLKVDGYTIYHAGDHALWAEELLPDFRRQLEYIRAKAPAIDLAFVPAARGLGVQCAIDSVIQKGVQMSAEILQPRVLALQHIGCPEHLARYRQIREALPAVRSQWIIPEAYNWSFSGR